MWCPMSACSHIPELIAARGLCTDLAADNDRLRDALVGLSRAVERGWLSEVARALDVARAALAVDAVVAGG